ncbi:NADH-quinone oxidoreductase subunit N [Cereibacter azotoformans]|uniref:NADH-quinone oxidoreductase subunit N n=1 Tax=Cereibacter azotoformans TaxID=43057 RepID=A0A2T5KDK7_9RHOB|nr:proton-conducting transporter membrane subunit [Cereibacter azotoformans]AXQ93707.1 NADH-quinone oxidoreductase subunit N [Cereibacter sphaeroides]MBO4168502.1 NADH-quinone oxidoreductase subunit N [Cereibacter azotoformans]PTR20508.1 NADH dehydrogenase subunit N [Cereibacter azotoformans]UIJ29211.1 NADH-quinone oxidoreductase subunit N [Cereibacter azotoformans]
MPSFAALLPVILLGTGAVTAMLAAPRLPGLARWIAGFALVAACVALALRLGAPDGLSVLLADDRMSRLTGLVVCLSGLGSLAFLRPDGPSKEGPALLLLATLGGVVLTGAVHAASLFLGLELITLALVALFVLPLDRPALEAGYKFLILGAAAAATLLMGLALGHAATGSLALEAFGGREALLTFAAALLLAGLAFKLALVPFHMWTPDAFTGAPGAAAAFAGAASKVAVVTALVRLDAVGLPQVWALGLGTFAGVSILLGNLAALRQDGVARMLGYSSVGHAGYIAAALATGAASAPAAALFYIVTYAPALLAALCVAALIGRATRISDLRGIVWRRPLAGAAMAAALVSLAGLPVSAGFFGKYVIFTALIEGRAWALLALAIAGSALGAYYYLRFVALIFRRAPDPADPAVRWPERTLLGAATAIILVLGIRPDLLLDQIRAALP